MVSAAKQFRPAFVAACAEVSDAVFEADGFRRRGLVYGHSQVAETRVRQRVDLGIQWRPPSQPGALALLTPRLQVFAPVVNDVLGKMMGDAPTWAPGVPLVNSPFEWFAAGDTAHWYVMVEDGIFEVVEEFAAVYAASVREAAVRLRSLEDLIAAGECDDRRVHATRAGLLGAAAASALVGQPERGLAILEARFTSIGARRTYAAAFEFLSARVTQADQSD